VRGKTSLNTENLFERMLFVPLSGLFDRELKRVVNEKGQIHIAEISNEDTVGLQKLRSFREKIYASENPALLSEIQNKLKIEEELDRRSFHFVAYDDQLLVGCLRVTPYPFEMETITSRLKEFTSQLEGYLELNRLVVLPQYRAHGIGKKLSYLCFLRFRKSDYLGMASICKKERAPTFERLGMECLNSSPIVVPERANAEYFVMAAGWYHLMRDVTVNYGARVLKRWFTGKDPYQK
jgi:predicted N-acetyltransferase YhbS